MGTKARKGGVTAAVALATPIPVDLVIAGWVGGTRTQRSGEEAGAGGQLEAVAQASPGTPG
jgi:hypothetical protein